MLLKQRYQTISKFSVSKSHIFLFHEIGSALIAKTFYFQIKR